MKQAWPDLTQIWLTDPMYEVIPNDWLDIVLKECQNNKPFAEDVWDCDNYALKFHACVQVYQYGLIKSGELDTRYSWAVGECIGYEYHLFSQTVHSMNLAITNSGILLIEPQTGAIKKPDTSYAPFFVKF